MAIVEVEKYQLGRGIRIIYLINYIIRYVEIEMSTAALVLLNWTCDHQKVLKCFTSVILYWNTTDKDRSTIILNYFQNHKKKINKKLYLLHSSFYLLKN